MLHTISEQKVICNWFWTKLILKIPLKNEFLLLDILITICVVERVWITLRYFLFEKQSFIGLITVIGMQNYYKIHKRIYVIIKCFEINFVINKIRPISQKTYSLFFSQSLFFLFWWTLIINLIIFVRIRNWIRFYI